MTPPVMTRDQAAAAVKAAAAERDAIQANLLELDSSFGKQLLAGAELTGGTRRRWDATAATLARHRVPPPSWDGRPAPLRGR